MLIIIITIICYKFVTNSFILSIFVNSGRLFYYYYINYSDSGFYFGGRKMIIKRAALFLMLKEGLLLSICYSFLSCPGGVPPGGPVVTPSGGPVVIPSGGPVVTPSGGPLL